jgi:RNA ligase (TIGR02306 family)
VGSRTDRRRRRLDRQQQRGTAASLPDLLPKTYLDRVQNIAKKLFNPDSNLHGLSWQETTKLDGQSMSVYFVRKDSRLFGKLPEMPPDALANMPNGRFGVCSRNVDVDENDKKKAREYFWPLATRLGLRHKLNDLNMDIAIQGEMVGCGIQKNREKLPQGERDFFVFSVYDIAEKKYFEHDRTLELAKQLGLRHVPVSGTFKIGDIAKSVKELLAMADGKGMNGGAREGLVFKSTDGSKAFKVISNAYLAKIGE